MQPLHTMALRCDVPERQAYAMELAKRLHLPFNAKAHVVLVLDEVGLALQSGHFAPVRAEFEWQALQKRLHTGKKEGLLKACKPEPGMHILDVTAGWGRDAGLLAAMGATVTMVERHPIMAMLLDDALLRRDALSKEKLSLKVVNADALLYLEQCVPKAYPDVIYMDPMHPVRQKSALVKKELQVLQQLIGPDDDALALLQLARTKAKHRVVVKWPHREKPLLEPDYAIDGKTIRFDCYLKRHDDKE